MRGSEIHPEMKIPAPVPPAAVGSDLCLACGLCCNGVLFRDVELRPGDNETVLCSVGAVVRRLKTKTSVPQPCPALCQDNRCQVYAERPQRCREFECALLKRVLTGAVPANHALRTIRTARQRSEKVRRLLRELGDADEQLPLSRRFNRTRRRLESSELGHGQAEVFAELTLAVHELNLLLGESFYT
jgi:hypothetical protein